MPCKKCPEIEVSSMISKRLNKSLFMDFLIPKYLVPRENCILQGNRTISKVKLNRFTGLGKSLAGPDCSLKYCIFVGAYGVWVKTPDISYNTNCYPIVAFELKKLILAFDMLQSTNTEMECNLKIILGTSARLLIGLF